MLNLKKKTRGVGGALNAPPSPSTILDFLPTLSAHDFPNRGMLSYFTSPGTIKYKNDPLCEIFNIKILAFSSQKTIKLSTTTFSGNNIFT